jgi:hypothetical protein
MSKCGVNRWGAGTTCEKPTNTESAKELQARIAAMNQERAKQDNMWTQVPEEPVEFKKSGLATPGLYQSGLRKQ